MKNILIIGATSTIANACASKWAKTGAKLFLVARNESKLEQISRDLEVKGAAEVRNYVTDLNVMDLHRDIVSKSLEFFGGSIDVALIAHGTLPDQDKCQRDVDLLLQEFSSNCLSVISIATLLANQMEEQQGGTLAVISSVAGDRGRQSNYAYGAAKSAVTTFCSGLRARLCKTGVNVLTIKPGFVETNMTKDLDLPKALVASPNKAADDICKAIEKGSNQIYTPNFWFLIMTIIKFIPEGVFKKLKL